MSDTVEIRRRPGDGDIARMAKAAHAAVLKIAAANGAVGPDEVNQIYLEAVYAAVVAGAVRQRKQSAKQ